MYLFDTNVISALRKPDLLDTDVAGRLVAIPETRIFVSVMTLFELELGVVSLERKDFDQGRHLRQWFEQVRAELGDRHILPVSEQVAIRCARLHVPNRRPQVDALIAATALIHDFQLVTRDVADFQGIDGLRIFNPWGKRP